MSSTCHLKSYNEWLLKMSSQVTLYIFWDREIIKPVKYTDLTKTIG